MKEGKTRCRKGAAEILKPPEIIAFLSQIYVYCLAADKYNKASQSVCIACFYSPTLSYLCRKSTIDFYAKRPTDSLRQHGKLGQQKC